MSSFIVRINVLGRSRETENGVSLDYYEKTLKSLPSMNDALRFIKNNNRSDPDTTFYIYSNQSSRPIYYSGIMGCGYTK